jgi:chemotaxis protein MotB
MLRRRRTEIHVNQERWLVSYADFITLLFAFFVVMYSISQVNQSKYRVLSETFEHAFPSTTPTTNPSTRKTAATEDSVINPIQVGEPSLSPASSVVDVRNENTGQLDSENRDAFAEISELFTERFADLIRDELVTVSSNELWLKIEMKDSILFTSGSADPSLQAQVIFDEIALVLKDYPNPVQVEGHTDNVPINSARYPSNWELSSARASAIVKWLATKGVEPTRLSAVGFGEFQPLTDNNSAGSRAQNRRVALMIARKAMTRPGVSVTSETPKPDPIGESEQSEQVGQSAETPDVSPSAQMPEQPTAPGDIPQSLPSDDMAPIELEDGGLLFTSDPELPRNGQ